MVELKNNTILTDEQIANVAQEQAPKDGVFNFPGHNKELIPKLLKDQDEKKIEKERARAIKEYTRKNYIVLTEWEDIKKVFIKKATAYYNFFLDDRVVFFVWKYSQALRVLDTEEQRQLVENLSEGEKAIVMSYVIQSKIAKEAQFINELGEPEITKSSQLTFRNKEKQPIWKVVDEKALYPLRRNLSISDLSYATIKEVCSQLNIDLTPKKTSSKK